MHSLSYLRETTTYEKHTQYTSRLTTIIKSTMFFPNFQDLLDYAYYVWLVYKAQIKCWNKLYNSNRPITLTTANSSLSKNPSLSMSLSSHILPRISTGSFELSKTFKDQHTEYTTLVPIPLHLKLSIMCPFSLYGDFVYVTWKAINIST